MSTELDTPGAIDAHVDPYAMTPDGATAQTPEGTAPVRIVPRAERLAAKQEVRARTVIRLPDYDQVKNNRRCTPMLRRAPSRVQPGNARALRQAHGERDVWLNRRRFRSPRRRWTWCTTCLRRARRIRATATPRFRHGR